MSKKLPHQISLEELLSSLEAVRDDSDDNLDNLSYKNDVPAFLSKFKIEAGEYFVKPPLLYKLYHIFSPEPLSQQEFSIHVGHFIPRTNHGFKLNVPPQKLLKILNPPINQNYMASSSIQKHFATFLEKCKITKGPKWVESFLLLEVYRFYCIDNKVKKRIGIVNFTSICKLHFEFKRVGTSKGVCFKLNSDVLDVLTPEHIERIKNGRKETKRSGKKATKK